MTTGSTPDWRLQGVRIVRSDELDLNTPQTPGMTRAAAITHASAGANKLWAPFEFLKDTVHNIPPRKVYDRS